MIYTIHIAGWHPWKKNDLRGYWAVAHKRKGQDKQVVGVAFRQSGIPPATGKRRLHLTIILGPRQRGGDVDAYNLSLLDALKACGAILDDRKECLELAPIQYEKGRGKKGTIIGLEDI